MQPVLTAEDVRRQDAEAAEHGVGVEALMGNAGRAVARAARRMLGATYGRRIVVLCGKGNNAGDGLVAARVLASQGAAVSIVTVFDEMNELGKLQRARFRGRVVGLEGAGRELARADLAVDAIFGVGLSRPPEGPARAAIDMLRAAHDSDGLPVLAVDVPSGLDADTGRIAGEDLAPLGCVRADATLTLGGYKPGLMFEPGRSLAGVVEVADIGTRGVPSAFALDATDVALWWPLRRPSEHKRSAGTVLVIAGSRAMPGAAALASLASVHAGAGLTVLCAPDDVCRAAIARVPEITTIPVPESSEGTIDEKALDLIVPRLDEFHAIAIGPGLSRHPATVEFVRALLPKIDGPLVLDADALNAFAGAPEPLRLRARNTTVLTPHAGELARLAGVDPAEIAADRLTVARRVAEQLGCVLTLKGPGTVTMAMVEDGQGARAMAFVNPTGGAALAQGGTGDVLTGIIASVLAQTAGSVSPSRLPADAVPSRVAAAVWVHGRAADRIAHRIAPHPANATALAEELGATIHEVCA
ncbi:MAG: NAD(P)H-hydrate dehydratase [Actinomycetota bacterium]